MHASYARELRDSAGAEPCAADCGIMACGSVPCTVRGHKRTQMAHTVRTEEGIPLISQLRALQKLRQVTANPGAALILATDAGLAEKGFASINATYAGFVAGLAGSVGLSPEQYISCFGRPVMARNFNETVAKSFDGLLASSSGVRACAGCGHLFFVNNTSNTAARHCLFCQKRAERDKKRHQRGTDLSERVCPVCTTSFTPKRSDARCCSGKCRAKLSRQEAAVARRPTPAELVQVG